MPAPSCNSTSQHEAAAGGEEPQLSVATSPPASSTPPKPLRTTVFTHRTTQRTVMPLPVQNEAESSVVEDTSLLRDSDVEEAVAVRNYISSTVRSRGAFRQPELNLEAVSLHELECVAAEGHQSSESPREHGHPDAPVESATSLPTLLVASSLLKLVNLPQARSTEHDDTSTNGLTNPSASSKNFDTNLQSALYSSDFNLTLAYSLPRSRRPRPPAGKTPHLPRAGSWNGPTRTRSRAVSRGHVAGPQRRVPSKNGSRRLSLQPTNTSTLPWHIRHSRRHLRLPLRHRGVFRRRRPPVTRPASDVGQGKHRTTNSSKVEARLKPPFRRRRLRVSLNHKGTTSLSHHDEEQKSNSDLTLKVTRGEESMTVSPAVSSVSLQPLHPEATFPEDANMVIPPATIPRPVTGLGNGRTGNPIGSEGRPRRRHRKPGRRPHLPGKLEGVRRRPGRRRRPGWRRMKRPLWAASSTPTPPTSSRLPEITSQGESTDNYDDLNMHPMEGNQETVLEAIIAGNDTTLTTPLLNTATESETQLGRSGDQQPTSVTTPTSSTSVESLEAPTETLDAVDEIWTTVPPVNPGILKGHTQDLPDIATQEDRGVSTPWRDTQDTDGTTTKRSTTTTTITTSMTREHLLATTRTPTTDDPASSSDRTQLDDGDAEFDVQDILPVDSSGGEGHLLLDADNMWLQNLFLSELREAIIPAPTPVPYTVRLWLEHDKKAADKAFFNQFVPLALDVVESDFVPLTHPVATVTEKDTSSDMFENEKSDDSGIGYVKDMDEVEATLVEEVIPPGDVVPPSQKQHPTTTAATVSRNDPLNFTYGLALDSVLPLGGDASDLSNGMEADLRSPPTISEIELHHKGGTTEERKENKKKKKKDKKKKETIAARRDQSNHKKKQNTVRPQRPTTTDDLGGQDRTPHAVVQNITNDSSPGRSSNIQLTFIPTNPTLSTPASPTVSIAMNYSRSPPHQETDVEHNTHVHAPPDTPSPTQDSPDNLFSSNKSQSHDQPPENDNGAPDRPAAADNNRGELLEGKETHGDSGAEAPLLHAVVAMAVLFTVL